MRPKIAQESKTPRHAGAAPPKQTTKSKLAIIRSAELKVGINIGAAHPRTTPDPTAGSTYKTGKRTTAESA